MERRTIAMYGAGVAALVGFAFVTGCNSSPNDPNPEPAGCENQADGVTCDDNNPCTSDDVCLAGVCGGTARDCSALTNACAEGRCDESGECVAEPVAQGTLCDADVTDCQVAECDGNGSCQAVPGPTGTACAADVTDCQVAECNMSGGCEVSAIPAGTECELAVGQCQVSACDGLGACQAEPIVDGITCDKEGFCNTTGTCMSGVCVNECVAGGIVDAPITATAPTSGLGGSPYEFTCPAGQVLIGVKGSIAYGDWAGGIRHFQGICATVAVDGNDVSLTRSIAAPTNPVGTWGLGADVNEVLCPQNSVITGIIGTESHIHITTVVNYIQVNCSPIAPEKTTDNTLLLVPGAAVAGDALSTPFGTAFGPLSCGADSVAVGFSGQKGVVVDAIAVQCMEAEFTLGPVTTP